MPQCHPILASGHNSVRIFLTKMPKYPTVDLPFSSRHYEALEINNECISKNKQRQIVNVLLAKFE
jgi:hypothetical protein